MERRHQGEHGAHTERAPVTESSVKSRSLREWRGLTLVVAIFGGLGVIGLLTLNAGIRQVVSGETSLLIALVVLTLGLVFTAIGFGFLYIRFLKKPIWDAQKAKQEARYPGQPWMLRKDWAARRVVHSNLGTMLLLWVWNFGWWGGLALIGTVNREKILAALAESSWNYALLAIFVGAGLIGLRFALGVTWNVWRFGKTVLTLDTLPAFMGGRFRGTVEARLAERPSAPFVVELVCERLQWVERRTGGKTESRLETEKLARAEAKISPSQMIASRGGVRIPVEIEVPVAGHEYAIDERGNGVRWVLNVHTQSGDTPFSCTFEVPVYGRRS